MSGQIPCPATDASTPPPGRCARFEAPAHWQAIDFISDLHLDAGHPRTVAAWADYMDRTPADAVLVLGDLFEAWVGDDARHQPFEAHCVDTLARAGQRLWLGLMVGNRDFLMGPDLMQACHAHALPDPLVLSAFGHAHLLTHGDAWCLDDAPYLQFRAQVRSAAWQAAFLARPLTDRLITARNLRDASEARKQGQAATDWADVDPTCAARWMHDLGVHSLIHGHTHRPASEPFGPAGGQRHVLADWDLDGPAPRAQVLRLSAHGLNRLSLEQALSAPAT